MPKFNVHLYREMKLLFSGVEADTPEAAAAIAREKPTADADDIEDCNGEDLAALIDVAGDDYSQSLTIDFEAERQAQGGHETARRTELDHPLPEDLRTGRHDRLHRQ